MWKGANAVEEHGGGCSVHCWNFTAGPRLAGAVHVAARTHPKKTTSIHLFMLLGMDIGMRQDICGLSGHSCFIRQQAKKSGGCFGLGFPSEIPEIPKTEKTHGSTMVFGFKMEPVLDCAGPVLSKKLKTPLVFEGLWLQDLEQDPKKVPRAPPPLEF